MSDRLRVPSLSCELVAQAGIGDNRQCLSLTSGFRKTCAKRRASASTDTRAELATECAVLGAHPRITWIPRVTLS
jgi:hypothetical protein